MLVEQFLRLLITAVRTSKVGVLFIALAVLIVFSLVVLGFVSLAGDLLLMASARVPMIHFLGTGWGILAAAASAVVFALLGVGNQSLWSAFHWHPVHSRYQMALTTALSYALGLPPRLVIFVFAWAGTS